METDVVREPDDAVHEPSGPRAEDDRCSLEAKPREILPQAARQIGMAAAEAMRRRLADRQHGDSGEILAVERVR